MNQRNTIRKWNRDRIKPRPRLFSPGRESRGISLATVLTMSLIITMFLSSMYVGLFSVYRKVATLRYGTTMRALNEAALDYVLDQYNRQVIQVQEGQIAIPQSVTNDPKATTVVTVTNQNNPPSNSILDNPLTGTAASSNYYLVEASTTKGPLTKKLRVLLQPIDTAPPDTPSCIFALFGANRVEFVGKAGINSYNSPDPRLYADIGTFGAGNQVGTGDSKRGVIQGGNQFEFPTGTQFQNAINATMNTYNAAPVAQASWAQVLGNIYSNGDDTGPNSGYWPRYNGTGSGSSNGKQDWNNVFGIANGTVDQAGNGVPSGVKDSSTGYSKPIPSYSGGSYGINSGNNNWGNAGNSANQFDASNPYTGGRVGSFMNYTPPTLPAAPLAPAGSLNLGNINITGNGKLRIVSGAPAPSGSIGNIGNGQTVTIPPGDYQVSTLSVSGTGSIEISPSVGDFTRFFLNPPPANTGNNAPPAVSFSNGTKVNMGYNGTNAFSNSGGTPSGMTMSGTAGFGPTPNANNMPAIDTSASGKIAEASGSANNFQLYTNSVCNIVMAGNARAYVDAPNATVNIGGQRGVLPAYSSGGVDANFYGGIIGGITRVISDFSGTGAPAAWMHYDANLRRQSPGAPLKFNDPWAFSGQQMNSNQTQRQYRAVTWQEV